jgi:hypothetical protein
VVFGQLYAFPKRQQRLLEPSTRAGTKVSAARRRPPRPPLQQLGHGGDEVVQLGVLEVPLSCASVI